MEESRKQFELAFSKESGASIYVISSMRAGDDYWDEANMVTSGISKAWHFWKASRAAIEIEMPDKQWDIASDGSQHYDCDEVHERIRAAGLRIKGE